MGLHITINDQPRQELVLDEDGQQDLGSHLVIEVMSEHELVTNSTELEHLVKNILIDLENGFKGTAIARIRQELESLVTSNESEEFERRQHGHEQDQLALLRR